MLRESSCFLGMCEKQIMNVLHIVCSSAVYTPGIISITVFCGQFLCAGAVSDNLV